jgi:hypothetical protein
MTSTYYAGHHAHSAGNRLRTRCVSCPPSSGLGHLSRSLLRTIRHNEIRRPKTMRVLMVGQRRPPWQAGHASNQSRNAAAEPTRPARSRASRIAS